MIDRILWSKRKEVRQLKLCKYARRGRPVVPFKLREGINVIAELKRKSPSAGRIGEIDDQTIDLYNRYATAISVLTDGIFFGGSFELLEHTANKTDLPVLCKDFFIDRTQIDMAYSKGADMILLIARILGRRQLTDLYDYALGKGLKCLIEVHTAEELRKISHLNAEIIGVNARDLDTLSIDLCRAAEIMRFVRSPVRIAESGIRSRTDMEKVQAANCFLVGETLMRSEDLESTFRGLLYG